MAYVPELVSGVFTVKAATETEPAKKVKFTKGNLYWNGSEFRCEANQYDYPTTREADHIGHFFWSNDARVAYATDYNAANTEFGITPTKTDTFFAADGGAIEGFTVLSKDEWDYLLSRALINDSESNYPKIVSVADKSCLILIPDVFSSEVADSYSAIEWATAEASGLVALPFAGNYLGSSISFAGSNGYYWSCTLSSDSANNAYYANFKSNAANTSKNVCIYGYSVRLVSVQ